MYVPLDVNFPDDDKIEEAGLAGAGLYAMALCIAKRTMSDGRVTLTKLRRLGADDALVAELVRLDLFRTRADDPGAVWITAFLAHNDDAATVEQKRSSDAQRKRATRRKRPSGLQADGAGASENVRSLEVEIEGESEVEVDPSHISGQPHSVAADPPLDDEQQIRKTAAKIGRRLAVLAEASNPAAYAAKVTREILTGPDPEQREHIAARLAAGDDPDTIAGDWMPAADPSPVRLVPVDAPRCAECNGSGWVMPLDSDAAVRCECNPSPKPVAVEAS